MSTNSSYTVTGLPTELLIRIFAHLQVDDLLSVQHTCRRFCDVISGSASLQYFLHTEINLLKNVLPSDFSLRDRVALLKHHETAWDNLELNEFTRFLTCEESHARCYILQDGYLIYKAVTNTAQYGYLDLYSSSTQPNAKLRWAHIPLASSRPLSDIVFAVDHNLVVTIRKPDVEVLRDYILVTVTHDMFGHSTFSVISWKTGRVTQLYLMLGDLRVVVIDPDNSPIALIKLPIFKYTNPISVFTNGIEWIPTSKPQDRTRTSRERSFPFRPYRAGTIGLTLSYRTGDGARQYSMFVSIGALLSVAHSVRDYDTLRTQYIKKKKVSIPTTGEPSLGPPSTKLFGEHWKDGEVKTHLPYRKFVAGGPSFKRVVQVVADREWVVVISRTRSRKRTSIAVYHVG
ncbi:hypothetical protein EDB86DRAFT_2834397 [Lactarius hatsudake]|nr:hypothetical protein EDB86DRAFT_2834397 [Lactarius hatsudake]